MKNTSNTQKIGEYDAQTYYGWAFQERELLLQPYLNAIGDLRGKSVLDLGCGFGWITKILSENAKEVFGVDISQEMIDIAKEQFFNAMLPWLNEQDITFFLWRIEPSRLNSQVDYTWLGKSAEQLVIKNLAKGNLVTPVKSTKEEEKSTFFT